jgi:GNAT superfamily N-acetyltransferase
VQYRGRSIGRGLIEYPEELGVSTGCSRIELKCPEGASANEFYKKIKFNNDGIQNGRVRRLICWSKTI